MVVKWLPVRGTSVVVSNFKLELCDVVVYSLGLKCPLSPGIIKHTRTDAFPKYFPKVIQLTIIIQYFLYCFNVA